MPALSELAKVGFELAALKLSLGVEKVCLFYTESHFRSLVSIVHSRHYTASIQNSHSEVLSYRTYRKFEKKQNVG